MKVYKLFHANLVSLSEIEDESENEEENEDEYKDEDKIKDEYKEENKNKNEYIEEDENKDEYKDEDENKDEDEFKDEDENEDEYEDENFEKYWGTFVERDKCKYKIIYQNKIYPLQSIFQIKRNKFENLKIKLISYRDDNKFPRIFHDLLRLYISKIEKIKKNMNMYGCVDYLFYKSHEVQKLIYNIDDEGFIRIFGNKFVEKYGNKCSIIYKDKIIPLQSNFLNKDINKEDIYNKKFEILLLEFEFIRDRSYMFYDCESLVEFFNFEMNDNEIKDNIIERENYLNSEEIEKFNNFYPNNMNDDIINKNTSFLSKETFNLSKLEFNKKDDVRRNYYSRINKMSSLFLGCSSLISLPDMYKWDTNDIKDMNSIFSGCSSLISLPDISKWNINNVYDMNYMF